MKKIVLFVFLCSIFSFADVLKLNVQEREYIKSLPDKKVIAKRFSNFYKFLNKAKKFDEEKKLLRTNFHLNKILPRPEPTNNWSSPKQFLINGFGDCEDYVIAKYFTLLKLGFDKKRFYLSVVKVKGSYGYHMVLIYKNEKNEALVLDNLSWKVLPLTKRDDLKFEYAFNEFGSFKIDNKNFEEETSIRRSEVKVFKEFVKSN